MNKKKIVLTFDYELFFGKKSGSIEKCLLEPTKKLLEISKKNNIKMTFFVDVLFYQKLLEVDINSANKIKKQLQSLVKNGHRIELHLHPHWLDAVYKDGKWIFKDYKYYRLHNLEKMKIIDLFVKGKQILEQIVREVDEYYNVLAFRAGGWCIQPFNKLKEAFEISNIKIDSSVAYGIKGKSKAHFFDFSNIPNKAFYYFEDKVEEENMNGKFIELPISTYKTNIFYKICRKIKKRLNFSKYKIFGNGVGISLERNLFDEIFTYEMFSLESIEPKKLYGLCKNYDKDYINIISHPKGLSNIALESLRFIAEKSDEFEFINIFDFYKDVVK